MYTVISKLNFFGSGGFHLAVLFFMLCINLN